MNQIGRKIYFEKATGNVLVDTGERAGFVVETTLEQDFEAYTALAERTKESVGCLQLEYGQDADKFAQYLYHIDPATQTIQWDLTPPQQEEVQRQKTMEEKVTELEQQNATMQVAINTLLGI